MLLDKLREYLESNKKHLLRIKSEESPSTYSYIAGQLDEIEYILEWINDLPKKDDIDRILKAIEKNNCMDTYSYMGFNYQELLQLKQML